jgi:hypothetical protein
MLRVPLIRESPTSRLSDQSLRPELGSDDRPHSIGKRHSLAESLPQRDHCEPLVEAASEPCRPGWPGGKDLPTSPFISELQATADGSTLAWPLGLRSSRARRPVEAAACSRHHNTAETGLPLGSKSRSSPSKSGPPSGVFWSTSYMTAARNEDDEPALVWWMTTCPCPCASAGSLAL